MNIDDKVVIYKFFFENENNLYLHKKIIQDFIKIIKYLNNISFDKENELWKNTTIYEIIELNDETSNMFLKLFQNQEGLTVSKIIDIFDYYLKLIYVNVSKEIKNYQESLDDKSIEYINNYFSQKHLITKKDFSNALRLLITLVLFLEEDKENKIKSNCNNIISYLNASDFWNTEKFNDEKFLDNLNELKKFKIKINQIIPLYEILGKDFEDNYFDEVKFKLEDDDDEEEGAL